jgi:hypothetical protein
VWLRNEIGVFLSGCRERDGLLAVLRSVTVLSNEVTARNALTFQ